MLTQPVVTFLYMYRQQTEGGGGARHSGTVPRKPPPRRGTGPGSYGGGSPRQQQSALDVFNSPPSATAGQTSVVTLQGTVDGLTAEEILEKRREAARAKRRAKQQSRASLTLVPSASLSSSAPAKAATITTNVRTSLP